MNNTIKLLMISDIFVLTGFGLVEPILAIFINDNIVGGSIFSAGLASTLFLITKSVIQLPFSKYVDKHDDKIRWLIVGTFFIALVPFIYMIADSVWYMYAAQIVYGIGGGLAYPTWLGLFSTHLDKKHESFEWSLYSTLVGIGVAISAVVGATIAEFAGFDYTFALVGFLALVGCFILLYLEKKEKRGNAESFARHYYTKRKLIQNGRH